MSAMIRTLLSPTVEPAVADAIHLIDKARHELAPPLAPSCSAYAVAPLAQLQASDALRAAVLHSPAPSTATPRTLCSPLTQTPTSAATPRSAISPPAAPPSAARSPWGASSPSLSGWAAAQPPAAQPPALPELLQDVNGLSLKLSEAQQTVQLLKVERDGLQKRVNALEGLEGEVANLKQHLADEARNREILQEERQGASAEVAYLKRSLASETKDRHDLEEKLCQASAEIADLKRCLADEVQDRQVLDERLREASAELVDLKRHLVFESRDREVVEQRLRQARAELEKVHEMEQSTSEDTLRAEVLLNVLRPLHDAYTSLREGFGVQTKEFEFFISRTREQHGEAEQQLSVARQEIGRQAETITRLTDELLELRLAYAEGCYEWQERVEEEAHKAEAMTTQMVERCKGWQQERKVLQDRLKDEVVQRRGCEEEVSRRDRAQDERNARRLRRLTRDPAVLRLEKALERNVAREVHGIHAGALLDKVHESNCKRERRLVVASADEMVLRWSKDLQRLGRSHTRLDLYEVIRIHYGSMARPCILYHDVPSWLCFSLYTPRRSYDFCCPDEATVQRFVLGLSRLCDWASGAVPTRSRFVVIKGWCKLEHHCFQHEVSLAQLFREAIARAANA